MNILYKKNEYDDLLQGAIILRTLTQYINIIIEAVNEDTNMSSIIQSDTFSKIDSFIKYFDSITYNSKQFNINNTNKTIKIYKSFGFNDTNVTYMLLYDIDFSSTLSLCSNIISTPTYNTDIYTTLGSLGTFLNNLLPKCAYLDTELGVDTNKSMNIRITESTVKTLPKIYDFIDKTKNVTFKFDNFAPNTTAELNFPNKSGTFATLDDISSMTSSISNIAGYFNNSQHIKFSIKSSQANTWVTMPMRYTNYITSSSLFTVNGINDIKYIGTKVQKVIIDFKIVHRTSVYSTTYYIAITVNGNIILISQLPVTFYYSFITQYCLDTYYELNPNDVISFAIKSGSSTVYETFNSTCIINLL